MTNSSPHISIIAGPNGAGKSTCGPAILQNHFHISEFVNADTIATGLSAFNPETVAISASRIMLKRIKQLAESNVNFAFETTLASRTFAPWIKNLKKQGYQFTLVYFWLHTPQLAIERVAERVRFGGHSVPTETIKRRYQKSIDNFFTLYQPLANHWCFIDNSDKENPVLIAEGNQISDIIIHQEILWNHIQRLANEN
jgi:predicted ABC-type ATPase